MIKKLLTLCALMYLSVNFAAAQNPSEQDEVVRVSTDLVQLDAVVIDKDGKQITNLTMNDFEIFQDGKLQTITQFSYINTQANRNLTNGKNQFVNQPQTSVNTNSNQFGRVITFVVDDGNCTASQIGMTAAREALEKFINEQMLPNDLVAIFQTRTGSILNQQYTSDKTQLRRIVRQIKWSPSTICNNTGGDLFETEKADYTVKATGSGKKMFESKVDRETRETIEDTIRENNALANLETLRYVTNRLKNVGGRKVIFFMSDGLTLTGRNNRLLRSQDLLRTLIAEANQSSIVFNSIDIRGLFNASGLQASDEILPEAPDVAKPVGSDKVIIQRQTETRNSQDGLAILANETGGSFSQGRNFLDVSIRDLLNLEKGFYLLGYQPDEQTFKGKKVHKIEIKLKRTDLRVLSRSGFSVGEKETKTEQKRTENGEIVNALNAPLPLSGLRLRLDASFNYSAQDGNFVNSVLRLNGSEITFVDGEKGMKKAVFEVTAVLFDEKGKTAGSFSKTHTISVAPQNVAAIKEKGIVYPFTLAVKKAGIYSLRVAVRDASSRQIGSAGGTIEIPDLQNGNLYFPFISLIPVDENGNPLASQTNDESFETVIPRFRRGTTIAYIYTLFNAKTDKSSKNPTVQTSLFQNGKTVLEIPSKTAELEPQIDRISSVGGDYLQLKTDLPIGIYTLRVTIKDSSANKTVEQWIDFEITE